MSHMFKSLPFYPTTPYLSEMDTLNFIPWNPQEENNMATTPQVPQKGADQKYVTTTVLEQLEQTNAEMEQFLTDFGDPKIESFFLDRPLRKKFKDPLSLIIIALCPQQRMSSAWPWGMRQNRSHW